MNTVVTATSDVALMATVWLSIIGVSLFFLWVLFFSRRGTHSPLIQTLLQILRWLIGSLIAIVVFWYLLLIISHPPM